MGILDVLIIVGFIAYAIGSGLKARSAASENLEEYFLAGRTLPGWKAGVSMAATQFAADTPLLVTGLIATAGIFSLWRLWIYALAFLLMGFVLAASWRRAGVITDAELTEKRYGSRPAALLRGVKAVYFGTVFNCTVLAMVLLAATRIAEPFLLWDQWLPPWMFDPVVSMVKWVGVPFIPTTTVGGVPHILDTGHWTLVSLADAGDRIWILSARNLLSIMAIVGVTTFYSTTGGLRSVVNTDVMQFGLMMVATFLFAWFVVREVGGLGEMTAAIRSTFAEGGPGGITPDEILAFTPSVAKGATFSVLAVYGLQWLVQMNADGTGYLAQRSMACKSEGDAKMAAIIFTVAQVFFRSLLWLPIGLGLMLVFVPDLSLPQEILKAERESTFVRGMRELLPTGVMGLMLTGMLAALASTVDTHLNWGSSYWTNDLYKRFFVPKVLKREARPKELVWVARFANIFILVIALAIMSQLTSIQTAWQASLLLGAGMGVILVLRWLWWRINAWGEISSIAASLILAPILLLALPNEMEALRLLIMAVVSTGVGLAVSLLTPAESMERLSDFFKTAHPPGFWGPVAEAVGEDPAANVRRLGRGVAAMGAAAFSIFCLLTAVGSWIADSPPPVWLPVQWLWITLLFLLGIGLIPVWLRLGDLWKPRTNAEPEEERSAA